MEGKGQAQRAIAATPEVTLRRKLPAWIQPPPLDDRRHRTKLSIKTS